MKEKTPQNHTTVSSNSLDLQKYQLNIANTITLFVYIPFAILLYGKGTFANGFLAVVTLLLSIVAIISLVKFIVDLNKLVTKDTEEINNLSKNFVFGAALPIILLKIYWLVGLMLTNFRHEGILCDIRKFMYAIDRTLSVQNSLTYLLVALGIFVYAYIFIKSVRK